jgi:uncharacterized protein (TIGR02996 family)
MLEQREAFLRAIFAAPDDDTPRLVYADWLDEHGDPTLAALIRLACAWARLPAEDVEARGRLAAEGFNLMRAAGRPWEGIGCRGFPPCDTIEVDAALLADAAEFRRVAAVDHPEWFGATRLRVTAGLITGSIQVETLYTAPATAKVTRLDLRGVVTEVPVRYSVLEATAFDLFESEVRPVITVLGVEALVNHRAARRLTELRLTNNELDNDAARMLVRSPYLIGLKHLDILTGNRLLGRTWQQILERFGDDVVGGWDTEIDE